MVMTGENLVLMNANCLYDWKALKCTELVIANKEVVRGKISVLTVQLNPLLHPSCV